MSYDIWSFSKSYNEARVLNEEFKWGHWNSGVKRPVVHTARYKEWSGLAPSDKSPPSPLGGHWHCSGQRLLPQPRSEAGSWHGRELLWGLPHIPVSLNTWITYVARWHRLSQACSSVKGFLKCWSLYRPGNKLEARNRHGIHQPLAFLSLTSKKFLPWCHFEVGIKTDVPRLTDILPLIGSNASGAVSPVINRAGCITCGAWLQKENAEHLVQRQEGKALFKVLKYDAFCFLLQSPLMS